MCPAFCHSPAFLLTVNCRSKVERCLLLKTSMATHVCCVLCSGYLVVWGLWLMFNKEKRREQIIFWWGKTETFIVSVKSLNYFITGKNALLNLAFQLLIPGLYIVFLQKNKLGVQAFIYLFIYFYFFNPHRDKWLERQCCNKQAAIWIL